MKKWLIFIAMAMFAFGLVVPSAYAEGNVNFFLGQKSLHEDFGDFTDQGEFGILFDYGNQGWPVHLAVDLLVSAKEGESGVTSFTTSEFDVGVRKPFEIGNMHPFVGGGIGVMSAEIDSSWLGKCEGSGGGVWADAGIFWTLGQSFNLGFDARYSSADVEFECSGGYAGWDGEEFNIGGTHFGLLLGFHW